MTDDPTPTTLPVVTLPTTPPVNVHQVPELIPGRCTGCYTLKLSETRNNTVYGICSPCRAATLGPSPYILIEAAPHAVAEYMAARLKGTP